MEQKPNNSVLYKNAFKKPDMPKIKKFIKMNLFNNFHYSFLLIPLMPSINQKYFIGQTLVV